MEALLDAGKLRVGDTYGRRLTPAAEPFGSRGPAPGTWAKAPKSNGFWLVVVGCPQCGFPVGLFDHGVDATGRVFPGVRCAWRACDWSGSVWLAGWQDGSLALPDDSEDIGCVDTSDA